MRLVINTWNPLRSSIPTEHGFHDMDKYSTISPSSVDTRIASPFTSVGAQISTVPLLLPAKAGWHSFIVSTSSGEENFKCFRDNVEILYRKGVFFIQWRIFSFKQKIESKIKIGD